ncbi:major facilitator superfamily domain-containing protein [Xylaria sp. CBS 124048]|nr:major facilitator superfamily domain-containing protein [Xylaria sp. CBS 124048]
METRSKQVGTTETDPLLGQQDAVPSEPLCKTAGNETFAINGSPKPKMNMVALVPALAIGIFLVSLDQTLTIAAYGKIGSELEALNSSSWIATSYFLTLTTSQPLYGKLSDMFGRKACLLSSYAVFAVGCLGCGLARDISELCFARAIAGIGGGGMNALVSILVTDLVSLRDRGIWQGYMNIIYALGTTTGGPVGGLFADSIGWRWAFIIQCPIAFLAFLAVYLVLHLPPKNLSHWTSKIFRVDIIGAITLTFAVFLLLFGLDNGSNEGWDKRITIVPLALTPVFFAIFVLVEAKVANEPFAPGHIVFDPPLLAAYGSNIFGIAAQTSVLFFIALFFQGALGMSATMSGLLFVPGTFLSLTGSLSGGLIMRRTGRYYWLTLIGHGLMLLSLIPMVLGAGFSSAAVSSMGVALLGFGCSMFINTTLISVIANAASEDTAVAIGCSYLFRSLGTTIGISITTATLQQMLRVSLTERLGGADQAREIEEQVRLSLDYIRSLDPDVAIIVRRCYAIATQWAFVPVAAFAVLATASAIFVREKKLDR